MQLYSLLFVLFVSALLVAHRLVGRSSARQYQWVVLLVGSLAFYAWSDWRNIVFLLVTSFSTWYVGLQLARLDAERKQQAKKAANRKEKKALRQAFQKRKWHVLLIALVLNFAILGYIKYWNVFLGYLHLDGSFLASRLLLPLGISFYTFTSLGYVIDVYNEKATPEPSYPRYLLFVSWFPQLIQGPINKWEQISSQLLTPYDPEWDRTRRALLLIGLGALKKYVMADTIAGVIANCLDYIDYSTPGSVIVFGIVLYSIQQYGDFSGGIDIVEGVSELFGVRMAPNFRQPYFAVSLADFWRRWHMSLGEWMRSYVFYPLAVRPSMMSLNKWGVRHLGKEVGRTLSACVSNIIVFLLVGLWHGAQLHYLLWGLYNGVIIALSDFCKPLFDRMKAALKIPEDSAGWHLWGIVRTFALVNIGRYFDRIDDPGRLLRAFANTVTNFQPQGMSTWLTVLHTTAYFKFTLMFAGVALVLVFIVDVLSERGVDVLGGILRLPLIARYVLYLGVGSLVAFSFAAAVSGGGFLYANF